MSDDVRDIVRDAAIFLAVVAAGLMVSWIIIKVQEAKPRDDFSQRTQVAR